MDASSIKSAKKGGFITNFVIKRYDLGQVLRLCGPLSFFARTRLISASHCTKAQIGVSVGGNAGCFGLKWHGSGARLSILTILTPLEADLCVLVKDSLVSVPLSFILFKEALTIILGQSGEECPFEPPA